ncbi:cytochrome P450 2H2-like [Liolophura sinensis]|uniref:cytochrome P450 2H2-like n=1 Tax=Liolophura sinensis TaxID=3198878 RepID=UPI003158AD38
MELITWVALCLLLLLSITFLINRGSSRHRLPPGPQGLPLIGCPWAVLSEFHVLCTSMAETWGEVVSINIMGKTIVALNSASVVREAFNSQAFAETFAGREPMPIYNKHVSEMTSFLQPGPVWYKLRKIVHKTLNHYGEGLHESERTIQEELTHVIEMLEEVGKSVNMDEVLYPSLINIMTILLKGRRYDYDSRVLENARFLDEVGVQVSSPANNFFLQLFPFLTKLNIGPGRLLQMELRAERQFLTDYYEESKATYSREVTRGMIDVLLRHQEEDGSSWMTDDNIKAQIQEMITAGKYAHY